MPKYPWFELADILADHISPALHNVTGQHLKEVAINYVFALKEDEWFKYSLLERRLIGRRYERNKPRNCSKSTKDRLGQTYNFR